MNISQIETEIEKNKLKAINLFVSFSYLSHKLLYLPDTSIEMKILVDN